MRRLTILRPLEPEVLSRIPEAHRPAAGALIERSEVAELDMPPFSRVVNRVGVILGGEEPRTEAP